MEWIGDEFILTEKVGNRLVNIESGKFSTTVVARTYVKALKISCLDMRKKIPKEFFKDFKEIADQKQQYLTERIEIVSKAAQGLK